MVVSRNSDYTRHNRRVSRTNCPPSFLISSSVLHKQLIATGVRAGRISTVGYGEAQPLEDNTTDAGKAQNRRVEIAIYANDRMKKAAEKGQL